MALPSLAYEPRGPTESALYQIVRDHFETFRVQAARLRDGEGLPRFVEDEFRAFLDCGWLAGGFARFRCTSCGLDRLVAFSCKGRGFCPSCGGRRMAERTAHLVDAVFPDVPVRQWVLSLPYSIRYLLAWDHDLCRAEVPDLDIEISILGPLEAVTTIREIEIGRHGLVVEMNRHRGLLLPQVAAVSWVRVAHNGRSVDHRLLMLPIDGRTRSANARMSQRFLVRTCIITIRCGMTPSEESWGASNGTSNRFDPRTYSSTLRATIESSRLRQSRSRRPPPGYLRRAIRSTTGRSDFAAASNSSIDS